MDVADRALAAAIHDLVCANRILANEGCVDGFGHVSVRHPHRPDRYLLSRARAPQYVELEDILEFDLEGNQTDGSSGSAYLERFIHGAIYEARSDVNSVVHSHSHNAVVFSVIAEPLRPLMHDASVIGAQVPVWDSRTAHGDTDLLVSNMRMGRDLAGALGTSRCALLRGHGAAVTGKSVRRAVHAAIYLELNAELQLEARQVGAIAFLSEGEIAARDALWDRLEGKPLVGLDRAWEYWCRRAGVEYRPPGAGEDS